MAELSEAFIYLWYDAPNKKYYLGKHKGSPDDSYTHSSTIWEHFTKDNIPEGVTRRILAYGTDEEMCVLEHELLVNRKERCWDRYYNQSLGDPRYVDTSGENNPMYGRTGENNPMYGKASDWSKKLWQDPEHQKMMSERIKKLWQDPEYQKMKSEKMSEQLKKLWQDPEHQKMMSERNKGKNNPMSRENRIKRAAEKQANSATLDEFLA